MIGLKALYNVLSAMVPLYVAMILAYSTVKWWKIFSQEQCAGINRFVAVFAVPLLSFHFLAMNNPYKMNYMFLIADVLQKIVIMAGLLIWAYFSRRPGTVDWVITLFSTATLPNTLIMGIPLLNGMYGTGAGALMIQIVFLQSLVWCTLLLFLFEYRDAMNLIKEKFPEVGTPIATVKVESDVISLMDGEADTQVGIDGRLHVTVRKSISSRSQGGLTPRSPFSPQQSDPSGELYGLGALFRSPRAPVSPSDRASHFRSGNSDKPGQEGIDDALKFSRSTSAPPASDPWGSQIPEELSFARGRSGRRSGVEDVERLSNVGGLQNSGNLGGLSDVGTKQMPPASVMTMIILSMVWRKLVRNPNTYASILGFVWSLIEFRFHVQLPTIVSNSISILSNTGLGMAMFSLGLFMALQPKLIACGNWVALFSMGVRFIIGPIIMALVTLAVGIRGDLFRIAVVQAALPQGIVPFVFAKEYNNHPTILSTGVIFGLLIALPIDLIYYFLLQI